MNHWRKSELRYMAYQWWETFGKCCFCLCCVFFFFFVQLDAVGASFFFVLFYVYVCLLCCAVLCCAVLWVHVIPLILLQKKIHLFLSDWRLFSKMIIKVPPNSFSLSQRESTCGRNVYFLKKRNDDHQQILQISNNATQTYRHTNIHTDIHDTHTLVLLLSCVCAWCGVVWCGLLVLNDHEDKLQHVWPLHLQNIDARVFVHVWGICACVVCVCLCVWVGVGSISWWKRE